LKRQSGKRIVLKDALGQAIEEVTYRDDSYSTTDGEGFSLVLADPDEWTDLDAWVPSTQFDGTPGM